MRRAALLSLACAVALGGCGGTKKGGLTPVGNDEATKAPADAQTDATVEMVRISYSPGTIRVRPGGKVTWINRDKVAHTVTVGDELYHEFDSGPIEPGKRYTRTFKSERKIGYLCTIHPNMEGTVFVQP